MNRPISPPRCRSRTGEKGVKEERKKRRKKGIQISTPLSPPSRDHVLGRQGEKEEEGKKGKREKKSCLLIFIPFFAGARRRKGK